jgi:hypothetical protein
MCRIIEKLVANDVVIIKEARKHISEVGIEIDLTYIKSYFTILTVSISKLQEKELLLTKVTHLFGNVEKYFKLLTDQL